MSCIFKWVQCSDLHFQSKSLTQANFNSSELKRKLPEFLASTVSNANALILTGDYRFAPAGEKSPEDVAAFIEKLAEALKLEASSIYLVPGNHDLDRGKIRNDVIRALRDDYRDTQGNFGSERVNMLNEGFSFFNELKRLVHKSAASVPVMPEDNPHYVVPLETCNLLLINTAITAGMEKSGKVEDTGKLLLGSQYLSAALQEITNKKPTIMVGHHGFQFLHPDEQKTCGRFLQENGVHLYLCGHTHRLWSSPFGDNGKELSVGCMSQTNQLVDAGFAVGELSSDGTVSVKCYKWDIDHQNWYEYQPEKHEWLKLYPDMENKNARETIELGSASVSPAEHGPIQKSNPFSLKGYYLIGGRGIDGIKYIWEKKGHCVESLAFNRQLKDSTDPKVSCISAYTCSVGYGCQLKPRNQQCIFCDTGSIPFYGDVSAEDIALQNIFMAEYDSDCKSFPQVRENAREFAFMGQGEPGLCYPSVRRAILLTDHAMEQIKQKVHRYIISTCGICDFMSALINDIKSGVFKNKVTVHFSLHEIDEKRSRLMPINTDYPYMRFLRECEKLYAVTGEKIGVGILMFDRYRLERGNCETDEFSLTSERLEEILNTLNKKVFRIDLCDVNRTSCGKNQRSFSNERANALLELVEKAGFEGKLFSSFGDNEKSGCGMLTSSLDGLSPPGDATITHFNRALDLLNDAITALDS